MSEEDEKAWARKRAQELEKGAADAKWADSVAKQEGERKLARLQTRLEAVEGTYGFLADGEEKPRATIVTIDGVVVVRWTRNGNVLCGSFKGSVGEHQTDSIDEAFDETLGFLKQLRTPRRTGT
jgi:hypothetical protein